MRYGRTTVAGLMALAALGLGACQTTTERAVVTAEQADALKATWLGKRWEGSWGGSCTGAVEVLEIHGDEAEVRYEWGICGNSSGGYMVDDNAVLSEREMKLALAIGTTADYVLQPDGSLLGAYRNRRGGSATGRFEPAG